MKTSTVYLAAFLITILLVMTPGCYTQLATTDDKYSDEYAGGEESAEITDTTGGGDEKYFDSEGYPLNRFYLGVTPTWVYGGVYWSTWSPWVYDPFWCWNPYPAYYGPGWGYWPPYYYYPPAYYPPYYPGGGVAYGYNSTRRFGSTRGGSGNVRAYGGGTTRGGEGTRAVEVASPGRTALDIPDAARLSRPGTGKSATPAAKTKPERLQRSERNRSTGAAVRGGSGRTTTGGATVRTPRRAPRSAEAQPSGGSGARTPSGSGRESVKPSSPPSSGGNAGRGSSRPATPPSSGGSGSGRGGGRR
jgi:hypothetical protein